ncbi:MAG: TIGR03621 family F420-dependent LLM class oxidoreductase [Thermomicrobiales bacterium]|nr:TIGR03621 family F420-dependent LLM class oxidoreductase [Thermomicrobiales bacterium]
MAVAVKPFKFGVQSRGVGPRDAWLASLRRIEALGYSSVSWADHFLSGLDPLASLAAAAIATERLRLTSFVLDNDFRHPVVVAMAAGTIDMLSGGRLELGIGAGWMKPEYTRSGIPFDPPGVRIARLEESLQLLTLLFTGEPVTFQGAFYQVDGLVLPPVPVQRPRPPFVIGGGSRKILTLAGKYADIVGITNRALPDGAKDLEDLTAEAMERKVGWVRDGAGARFPDIELNMICGRVVVTDDREAAAAQLAGQLPLSVEQILDAPAILIGSVDEIVATLKARRERFGVSNIVIVEPMMEAFAPVVAQLAGR